MSNKNIKPKVVILAGGRGMRLQEETEYRPKPMVPVGPHPILWHIMKTYIYHGFNDFVICLGYKGEMIKEYFLNYETYNNDFTVEIGKNSNIRTHKSPISDAFTVTLADTGIDTLTGGRIKNIQKYVDGNDFMLTYGDGVSDINIKELYSFHKEHGKIATVTGVHPESRFGELVISGDAVKSFSEKPQIKEGYISGGFFIFDKKFFDYLDKDKDCYFEREPMKKLAKDGQLYVFRHDGFWQCMDTYKDMKYLNDLWGQKKAPWKAWK